MLRRRSLGTIVGVGFASVLVMLAAVIALAIREVDVAQDQRQEMTARLQLAEAADRLALHVSQADLALRDFVLGRALQDFQAAQQRRELARLAAVEVKRLQPEEVESRRLAELVVEAAARWDRQAADAEALADRLRADALVPFERQYLNQPTADVVAAVDELRERLNRLVEETRLHLAHRGDRLTQALVVGFGLAGLVGILLGIYFVRLVTEPVSRLVAVADAVRAGDYPMARRLVGETSPGETGPAENEITLLTQTFAHMAETLEEREQRLRAHAAHLAAANHMLASLQSLTDAALSELGLRELLEQLLQRLLAGLGGDVGILFRESLPSGRLEPRVSVGLEAGDGLSRDDSAADFARAVAQSGRLLVVPDRAAAPAWKDSFPAARGAGAFIAMPIHVNGKLSGVAYVEFRTPRSFEPPQVHLVQAFGERVERAIERAESMEAAQAWQRDLERQVAQQQDQLLRSERLASIGLVGGSIAHELRNPLGVISNSIYFLRHRLTPADEKVRRHLEIIAMEVAHATGIINNLVDFSTSIEPVTTRVNLNALIEAALEGTRVPPEVRVELDLQKPLPLLLGDETQLLQVFEHLIRNAVQAMEDGGRLRIVTEADASRVRAAVEDTGPGIPPEDQERIFEPLVGTRAKGIGLGLTLSRRIVEAHGGEIGLQSEPGRGATFTVELPVSEPASLSTLATEADAAGSRAG